jgi:gamma-glutamyl-gamma-aminobutyrate hydrolase PuuD
MKLQALVTYRDRAKAGPYAEALRMAGLDPVLVSPEDPRGLEGNFGLLLTGGTDVNPTLYGQRPDPRTQVPDDARDALESSLLREALERDLPVLAICRGMQLLNVVHGGTLVQHLEGHSVRTPDPAQPIHDVIVTPNTLLGAILGQGPHPVNSRHHQSIGQAGACLIPTAWSTADRVVEGLERPDRRFVAAVQWHPEDQARVDATQRHLFECFAGAIEIAGRKGLTASGDGSAR